jgi:hypothetical protein
MSFVRRRIDLTITLGTGTFGADIGDTVTLTHHRIIAEQSAVVGDTQGQIQLRIYGMPLDMMNRLTTTGPIMTQIRDKNRISVAAGDDGSALTTIFEGAIDQAWADFKAAPSATFNITGLAALVAAVKPVEASSYRGSADVAAIMSDLAKQMGFAFENNGVTAKLSNPYLPGTALDQMKAVAKAAGITAVVDRGTLAIYPKAGARAGDVPLLSPEMGLVGYPTFSGSGVAVESLFLPSAKLGGQIDVKSAITAASGRWNIYALGHSLESEMPDGQWFTRINCFRAPS